MSRERLDGGATGAPDVGVGPGPDAGDPVTPDASEPDDGGAPPERDAGAPDAGGPPICDATHADCDGLTANGCEVDLASDASHCGDCATACEAGASCVDRSCAHVVRITELHDAYVASDTPTTAHGAETTLLVDGDPVVYHTFVQPALGAIPAGATIGSASLELTCTDAGSRVRAFVVTGAWSEASVTWDTAPATEAASFTDVAAAVGVVRIDVTDVVRAWASGTTPNHGVMLDTSGTDGSDYRSAEFGTASARPAVVVTYR